MEKGLKIKSVAVVGGGIMGAGIIYTLSSFGFSVCFKELNDELIKKCIDQITQLYASAFKKGKMKEDEVKKALSLIQGRSDYQGIEEVDLAIEAVPEDINIKRNVFQEIDRLCKPEAIFASNTSALPISELASFTERKSKFIGMHWFNPPQVMRLIEVVPGLETSEETIETIITFSERLGKVPIRLKECAGFLVARLLGMYVNEAFWMLGEKFRPADIDQSGIEMGMPMGPFTLGDMAGWDVVLHANQTLYESYGMRFKIPPLFHDLVASGKLGVKTGQGIYSYQKVEPGPPQKTGDISPSPNKQEREILSNRFLWTMINEGIRCLDEGIAKERDIDKALQLGAGMPKGPLAWADEIGLDWIFTELENRKGELGERYWPSPLLRRKVKAGLLGQKVGKGFYNYPA
ncbi:MAG: 3-hydroxyacyl-CoA dehydrogenase [Syntrophaceae bacterium]|nr:3-hydroxyacyl-CoA dehydrogenase [Syntrophaceae bacterium]